MAPAGELIEIDVIVRLPVSTTSISNGLVISGLVAAVLFVFSSFGMVSILTEMVLLPLVAVSGAIIVHVTSSPGLKVWLKLSEVSNPASPKSNNNLAGPSTFA